MAPTKALATVKPFGAQRICPSIHQRSKDSRADTFSPGINARSRGGSCVTHEQKLTTIFAVSADCEGNSC